jgi:hypothetical protein
LAIPIPERALGHGVAGRLLFIEVRRVLDDL